MGRSPSIFSGSSASRPRSWSRVDAGRPMRADHVGHRLAKDGPCDRAAVPSRFRRSGRDWSMPGRPMHPPPAATNPAGPGPNHLKTSSCPAPGLPRPAPPTVLWDRWVRGGGPGLEIRPPGTGPMSWVGSHPPGSPRPQSPGRVATDPPAEHAGESRVDPWRENPRRRAVNRETGITQGLKKPGRQRKNDGS